MKASAQSSTWPLWFRVLFLGVAGAPTLLILLLGEPRDLWIGLIATFLLLLVWRKLARVDVQVDEEGLQFGFGGLHNRVPWSRVRRFEAEDYRALRYGGWGYRMAGWRDRAYSVLGERRGVRVEFEDEKGKVSKIFLSCPDPDRLVDAVNRKISFR
ncbi:MAG: hypothetical protein AAGD14_10125 [Planctomycetota bacterium]